MSRFSFASIRTATFVAATAVTLVSAPMGLAAMSSTGVSAQTAQETAALTPPCTAAVCTYAIGVNPGLLAGKPFACPAIQHAGGTITIINRAATHQQADTMIVNVHGLPRNTGFDLFTVQNTPLDPGAFPGFGFGWYQSDLDSNAAGAASVSVRGIFDRETFIENPASPFAPIHTYNVGFWFNSPADEKRVCGNTTAPAATPFNGEQNAGLLAMITRGEPLQAVH